MHMAISKYMLNSIKIDKKRAVTHFKEMIQYETVAGMEDEFVKFRHALKDMYPNISKTCEYERIGSKGIVYRLKGQTENESILLMSHYDVVPAENGTWKYPPFSGTTAEGRIWGRGTLDTKCTLCAIMESVETLISQGFKPHTDVYLCFGGDEETTGDSAKKIAEILKERGVRPALILDEGGAIVDGGLIGIYRPCALIGIAEKGNMDVEFIVRGSGGHTSLPAKSNPVTVMAEVVKRISNNPFPSGICRPFETMMKSAEKYADPKHRILLKHFRLGNIVFRKILSNIFPEIEALSGTIGTITRIEGGNAENMIPEEVRAVGNFRIISGSSIALTLKRIKQVLAGLDVEINLISGAEPSAVSAIDSPGFKILTGTVKKIWKNSAMIPYLMLAGSDSRSYTGISDSIYRFSPMKLTKEERNKIHGINENITEKNFFRMISFYMYLLTYDR